MLWTLLSPPIVKLCLRCHHTKFHTLSSNGSLLIGIKRKTKYRFRAATMLLFYLLQNIFFKRHFLLRVTRQMKATDGTLLFLMGSDDKVHKKVA